MRVVALAGGVGGARLAFGLQSELGADLTVIVNTGDDLERHGLLVSPDLDTVMYTLAGLADPAQGWGLAGETYAAASMLDGVLVQPAQHLKRRLVRLGGQHVHGRRSGPVQAW